MSHRLIAGLAALLGTVPLWGQVEKPPFTGPSIGFHLGSLDGPLALGLEASTPLGHRGAWCLRFSADQLQYRGTPLHGSGEETREPFGVARLGAVGVGAKLAGCIRLYGEGGILAAFPGRAISTRGTTWGGYGHFGFEFLIGGRGSVSYFIEMGSVGTGARADQQVGKPIYLSGFAARTGLRIYL